MAKEKKEKTVVVDEPVQATQTVKEVTTAWVATEAEQVVAETAEATEWLTTINTAEALDARKAEEEKPEEEKAENENIENPEGEGEEDHIVEDNEKVEKDEKDEKEMSEEEKLAAVVAANNAPIRQIPSRVITDPFGKKTTIYQPQVVRKVYKDSNVKNAAVWVNARRGEIVREDEMLKKD